MSRKDLGYKRIVQYFWDPEPKNDDPSKSTIWCLGQRYGSNHLIHKRPSSSKQNASLRVHNVAGRVVGKDENSDHMPTGGEETSGAVQSLLTEEERGWPLDFLDDFEARFWFTYRSNFAAIKKSNDPSASASVTFAVRLRSQLLDQGAFSSDTGWGYWRRGTRQREERQLVALFADDPKAPFSIHRFVAHGASACGKHPGEWFGPSATARCIQSLAQEFDKTGLQVYINADGADVYEDKFYSVATAAEGKFTPTLILIGIRLGIDRITPVYWDALKAALQLPQSVGIAGGRPSSSHYFVGVQGNDFFFLDPHQTRPALPRHEDVMDYSEDEVSSCHTRRLRRLSIEDMDPSMLIAFLIQDRNDWNSWRSSIDEVSGKAVVHIADREPPLHSHETEPQSGVDDVEVLDEDEDEDELEMVDHPT